MSRFGIESKTLKGNNNRKVGEVGMNDPYEKVWEEIRKGFDLNIKMIKWIAERTLSVKDYKEFIDEFTKKHDNHDELLDFLRKEGR